MTDATGNDNRDKAFYELSGNYEYLTEGYYRCQDAQLKGIPRIMPSCRDALDAYVVPIALQKASLGGIAVPDWYLTNEYFHPPAVVYGVNPFSRKYAVVFTEQECEVAAKQLTWNYKYSVCCQRITAESQLVDIAMIAGRTARPEMAELAQQVYEVFSLPMANIRVILTGGTVQLSALELLPKRALGPSEREWLNDLQRSLDG